MKNLIIVFILFNVTIVQCQNYIVKYGDKEYMHREKLPSNFKQGFILNEKLPDGNWSVVTGKDSTIVFKGQYLSNKKQGLWKNYDENGILMTTNEYDKGKIILSKTYYRNGKISMKIVPLKKKIYVIESYYITGEIKNKYKIVKGKKHGLVVEYFLDGKVKSVENYRKGIRIGLQKD